MTKCRWNCSTRRHPSAELSGRHPAMSATSPGLALRHLRAGLQTAWGMPASFKTPCPPANPAAPQSASGRPKPAERLRSKPSGGIAGRARLPSQGLKAGFALSQTTPGCPQRVLTDGARTIQPSPHRCRSVAAIPMTVDHRGPDDQWDAPMAFGWRSRWTMLGAEIDAVEHWNAETCAWPCLRRCQTLRRLQPIGDRAVQTGSRSVEAALADGSTAPSIARSFPTDQVRGAAYGFVAEPQKRRRRRFNRTLKEQIIGGRIYRNIGLPRDAFRDLGPHNARQDRRRERTDGASSPAQARQAWSCRSSSGPRVKLDVRNR